jgi:carboxyl-terminal processing protease
MAGAIRGYLATIDVYSTYLTAKEYAAIYQAPKRYGGIGMDLLQGRGGEFYCLPYTGSPAARGGIIAGDVLFSVNSVPVSRYSPLVLESLIRGEPGSVVVLGIVSAGQAKSLSLTRATINSASVEAVSDGHVQRIHIHRFDADTVGQLRQCLANVEPGSPLILDLRGNVGGDLRLAVAAAGLFLPTGALVATLADKTGKTTEFRVKGAGGIFSATIALWQDRFTASAAEVFCAALRDHGVATTFGQTSFGKGVSQSVIPVGDGDFFVITTGRLLRPGGETFDQHGLPPDFYISPQEETAEQDFMRKSLAFFGIAP